MPNFSTKNILATFLILFPVIVFYLVFQKYAVNIPHWDDFAIRNTLAQMLETDSFSEKLKLLFSQHNEHRILLTRLSAWFVYLLQGTLNLKSLMFIGFLALVGLLVIFFQVSKKYKSPLLAFVPVSFILFNIGLFDGKTKNDIGRFMVTQDSTDIGAFETPTLRNIALTAPYMHDGSMKTLKEVLEYYNEPDKHVPNSKNRHINMAPLKMNSNHIEDLEAFLRSLTDNRFKKNSLSRNSE